MSFDAVGTSPIPAPRSPRSAGQGPLHLRTYRPGNGVVVIKASGALDMDGATRFAELMRDRLTSTARTVVLDLSGLSFLSTHGAVVLLEAEHRALIRAVSLVLVTGNRPVDRLLRLLDIADRFSYAPTVETAIELPRRSHADRGPGS